LHEKSHSRADERWPKMIGWVRSQAVVARDPLDANHLAPPGLSRRQIGTCAEQGNLINALRVRRSYSPAEHFCGERSTFRQPNVLRAFKNAWKPVLSGSKAKRVRIS
jgi:hypothetical protein